jgi:hypothetical protein
MTHTVKSYAYVSNRWYDLASYRFEMEVDMYRKGVITAEYSRDVEAGTALIGFREYVGDNPVCLGKQEQLTIHKDVHVTLVPEKVEFC